LLPADAAGQPQIIEHTQPSRSGTRRCAFRSVSGEQNAKKRPDKGSSERYMPLTATADPGHHHFATDTVYFYMNDGERRVRCGISRLALEVLEPELPPTKQGRMQAFTQHRIRIERVASAKFDHGQLEPDGSAILVRAADLV
jgi:hypothetical protein